MNGLMVANWLAFLFVTAYALFLFAYVVKTRYEFIKLGKKVEFDNTVQERIKAVLVNVFGQKKLLKDKKAELSTLCFLRIYSCPVRSDRFYLERARTWVSSAARSAISRVHVFPRNRNNDDHGCSSMGFL